MKQMTLELSPWRSLVLDPPSKTGRYIVGHSGHIGGDAFYTANEGDTHYDVGWAQVPSFGPTHWLDCELHKQCDEEAPRLWEGTDGSGRINRTVNNNSEDARIARRVRQSRIGRWLFVD